MDSNAIPGTIGFLQRRLEGNVIAKRILGGISILMGVTILAWFAYNLARPTPEFRFHFRWVFQLIVPAAMIWFGWRWLSYGGPGTEKEPH